MQGLNWPFPIRTAIKKYAPGVEPLRVALLGFSESCHGVRDLLTSGDGMLVDSVVAIDGLHTPYVNGKKVDPNTMKSWLEFAKLAVVNERLFVDTHSSIVPPNYASTTETADWLWKTITNEATPFTIPPLPDLSAPATSIHVSAKTSPPSPPYDVSYPAPAWQPGRRAGGLVVLGCDNVDPRGYADHIYQAKVLLPLVLKQFLVERWNAMDPKDPGQSCFIAGTPGRGGRAGSALGAPEIPKCASAAVWPAGALDSTTAAYLPGMEPKNAKQRASLLVPALLVGVGALGLWWLSQPSYRLNPYEA